MRGNVTYLKTAIKSTQEHAGAQQFLDPYPYIVWIEYILRIRRWELRMRSSNEQTSAGTIVEWY